MNELWTYEKEIAAGFNVVCGADEAGRGPLAGPVCAAAVILPHGLALDGLNDSKKLSAKMRERLYDEICSQAVSWAVDFAGVDEIESLNILNAAMLAMDRAVARLDPAPELAIIDGNTTKGISVPAISVVGGDAKCASVAAASIIAKVTRDRLMHELAEKYPMYGFDRHKGYGTKAHYEAIREYGPCREHRMSFLKKFLDKE